MANHFYALVPKRGFGSNKFYKRSRNKALRRLFKTCETAQELKSWLRYRVGWVN